MIENKKVKLEDLLNDGVVILCTECSGNGKIKGMARLVKTNITPVPFVEETK